MRLRRDMVSIRSKVKKITGNRIFFTYQGQQISGTYPAYVGAFSRIIKVGEVISGDLCKWDTWTFEPAWMESMFSLTKKGEQIIKGKIEEIPEVKEVKLDKASDSDAINPITETVLSKTRGIGLEYRCPECEKVLVRTFFLADDELYVSHPADLSHACQCMKKIFFRRLKSWTESTNLGCAHFLGETQIPKSVRRIK